MTDEQGKPGHDDSQVLDETELAQDLEIKDAEDADAVVGGATFKVGADYKE